MWFANKMRLKRMCGGTCIDSISTYMLSNIFKKVIVHFLGKNTGRVIGYGGPTTVSSKMV